MAALRTLLAMAITLLIALSPAARSLEATLGIDVLHTLRGVHEPPPGALVVTVDRDSVRWLQRNSGRLSQASPFLHDCLTDGATERLAQAYAIELLPREVYGCLVRRVTEHQAGLIVFNINFGLSLPSDDTFAKALKTANNTLLLERIDQRSGAPGGPGFTIREGPAGVLGEAALGTHHFLVEALPDRPTLRYITRLEGFPELASKPVAAYRQMTGKEPDLPERKALWFYGPPRTLPNISLRALFDTDVEALALGGMEETVVFVGVAASAEASNLDRFIVPDFGAGEERMSGVELGATAYLNLLHGHRMAHTGLGGTTAVLVFAAMLYAVGLLLLRGWRVLLWIPMIAAMWTVGAVALLHHGVALPWALPALVFPLIALVIELVTRLQIARRIARAALPRYFSGALLEGRSAEPESEPATAMFVDIAGSVTLAEQVGNEGYSAILKRYYDTVNGSIEGRGGAIFDYQGDGVLALFSSTGAGASHARAACEAAQSIRDGIAPELSLRVGIATGPTLIGALTFGQRLRVSAMGDTVHVAARLQELAKEVVEASKEARVAILVDETTAHAAGRGAELVFFRETTLRGRSTATRAHLLTGVRDEMPSAQAFS
ncbi:MAG: CHASE2 domain-containing protein [Pseudomonadota bacterium]